MLFEILLVFGSFVLELGIETTHVFHRSMSKLKSSPPDTFYGQTLRSSKSGSRLRPPRILLKTKVLRRFVCYLRLLPRSRVHSVAETVLFILDLCNQKLLF